MLSPRSSDGRLPPFRRRFVPALLAAVAGVLASRLAVSLVPGPEGAAALGDFLFGVAVQALVSALVWPFAERLLPPERPGADE